MQWHLGKVKEYVDSQCTTWGAPKFCYLGEEAARARVRCAWAKFKELFPILTTCDALYHMKGKIYRACFQFKHVDIWNWNMDNEGLKSVLREQRILFWWWDGWVWLNKARICGYGRVRWLLHLRAYKNVDDCRSVEVVGAGFELWKMNWEGQQHKNKGVGGFTIEWTGELRG